MEKTTKAAKPQISTVMDAYSSKIELAYHGSREDLDPYVPADHRPHNSKTSSFGALANLLKASLGSGVLAMPVAFKNAGMLVGAIGTILVGLICGHAIHILDRWREAFGNTNLVTLGWMVVTISGENVTTALCRDKEALSRICRHMRTGVSEWTSTCSKICNLNQIYEGITEACTMCKHIEYITRNRDEIRVIHPWHLIREIADWALATTHFGACCVYVVIIAESFKQISDAYGGPSWSVSLFCAVCLVVLVPLSQITKLKYLVPFSAFANFVWLGSICICLYYCLKDPPAIKDRNLATSITAIPSFISICLFAMEGIGVVMPVENEMIKPQQFLGCPGVLNIAITTIVIFYGFVGFSGYWQFGNDVSGSLTLSLPQDEILAQTAKILVACVMILSFTLIYYIPVDVVWRRLQDRIPANRQIWALSGIRLLGTLIIVSIASAVPYIELFMELVGAICLSVMGLLLPVVTETVFRWGKDVGPTSWVVWKNFILAIFALIALVSGVTYAFKSLLEKFSIL